MEVRQDVESDIGTALHPAPEVTRDVNRLDRAHLTVGHAEIVGRSGELHAVTDRERALDLAVHRHTGQASRIVRLRFAVLARDGDAILFGINVRDARAFAGADAQGLAAARITHDVVDGVLPRPAAVGARHLLSG